MSVHKNCTPTVYTVHIPQYTHRLVGLRGSSKETEPYSICLLRVLLAFEDSRTIGAQL